MDVSYETVTDRELPEFVNFCGNIILITKRKLLHKIEGQIQFPGEGCKALYDWIFVICGVPSGDDFQ